MEDNTRQNETAERLKYFHAQTENTKTPKEGTHSESILQICAVLIIIFSILYGVVLWLGQDYNFFIAFGITFAGFTFGVFLYVIGKICRLLSH